MKRIILLAAVALLASVASAQTVGPTAMEFKGPKAHGTIMVSNNGVGLLTVTVELQSFTWKDGGPVLAVLDPTISFESKQQKITLGPQQTKYIDFNARCTTLPCHFYVTPVFTNPQAANGLTVAVHMPVAVYLCSQQKACRKNTLLAAGAITK